MKGFVFAGLFLLLSVGRFFPGQAFAGEAGQAEVAIEVENSSAVINENLAQARMDAIQGALQKAVEQAATPLLTPETMVAQAKILREGIFLKADQYIPNYRITGERSFQPDRSFSAPTTSALRVNIVLSPGFKA